MDLAPVLWVTPRIYKLLLKDRGNGIDFVDVEHAPGYLVRGFYADDQHDLIICQAFGGHPPAHWTSAVGYC
jgi:hypothetical protein